MPNSSHTLGDIVKLSYHVDDRLGGSVLKSKIPGHFPGILESTWLQGHVREIVIIVYFIPGIVVITKL